jgi:quercetin dioxygenase-like cupin family protein
MIKFVRFWRSARGMSASVSRRCVKRGYVACRYVACRYVARRCVTLGLVSVLPFAAMVSPAGTLTAADNPAAGTAHLITPLKSARFAQDDDVKCLMSALENGNPDTGPSTFLLKAPAGCKVAPHYHSSEEQLIVIRGRVLTEMKGMSGVTLTAGGVAVMPAKAVHWFSCSGKDPCLMAVTFNQKYDIVWVDSAAGKP